MGRFYRYATSNKKARPVISLTGGDGRLSQSLLCGRVEISDPVLGCHPKRIVVRLRSGLHLVVADMTDSFSIPS
jgi:hypothetical protein